MSNKNINSVVLDGNITKDVELNQNQTVGRFTLAVNESQKNPDGSWNDYANFFDCKIFGNSAKNLAQYLTKGKRVVVSGKLRQDRWEKDGQKQSRVVVNVNEISFAGGGSGNGNGGTQYRETSDGNFTEQIPF